MINKLCIDVETSNPASAFDLKDNIDAFFKHDILPYLENYFSTIEEGLHSHVIQIPYVSVNVDTSSSLNYSELKEDVKRALTKEIQRVTKIAHPHSEEAKLITRKENKEVTFLHFLETGTSPWWIKSEDTFELMEKDFESFLTSKSFLIKLRSKLMNSTFRNRMIYQLSDQQLVRIVESVDSERTQKLWKQKYFTSFNQIVSTDRKVLWDCLLDDALQKNDEVLTSRLIFQFIQKLSETEYKEQVTATKDTAFFQLVIELLSNFYSTEKVQNAINIVKNSQLFEELNFELENTGQKKSNIDLIDKVEKSLDEIEKRENKIKDVKSKNHENQDKEIYRVDDRKEFDKTDVDKVIKEEKEIKDNIKNQNVSEKTDHEKSNEAFGQEQLSKTEAVSRFDKNLEKDQKIPSRKKELQNREKKPLHVSQVKESLSELIEKEERSLFQEIDHIQNKEKTYDKNKGEIHINNAGLILLHPYLKDFFKNCNLLDQENQIIDPAKAVHVLHYVATKREQQFESNMVFEKILCGVPIQQSIQRTIELSEELKANTEELLEAVLGNWGVLKNASPDLLRSEFLQRFGKISFKEVNPKITVERKVHDILLDKLPWNIGISRLPWLDHLLFTDW